MNEAGRRRFRGLSYQAAAIVGLAVFIWCLLNRVPVLGALFRGAVVYLVLSIVVAAVWMALMRATAFSSGRRAGNRGGQDRLTNVESPSHKEGEGN